MRLLAVAFLATSFCLVATATAAAAAYSYAPAAASPRDALLDESWRFYYGPGNASTFFLEAFDDGAWPLVTLPHDISAQALPPRSADTTNAPVLEIRNGTWLFQRGDPADNVSWAAASWDDSGWQQTQVPGDWRQPPLSYEEYNAFGWFRRHFTVAEWQVAAAEAGSLNVALGTVAAANIAWINGKQVGGSIPSDANSLNCYNYGLYQQYAVPPGLLVGGGGDNVIAVRLLAQGGPANATAAALAAAAAASPAGVDAITYNYEGEGFLAAGDDVASGEMTLAAAEALCSSLPLCCGITFASALVAPTGNVTAYLKSQLAAYSPAAGWQSYRSSRPCVQPSFPGGLFDVSWGDMRIGALDPGASVGGRPTGYAVGGVSWYRRAFATPAVVVSGGGRASLRFDGVYMLADVYVNGDHLGQHPYGYTTFAYDVTPLLHVDGRENVVAVRVNNFGRNSRWYSGGGIYRHVWLTSTPPLHVQLWGVGVATVVAADGSSASATVTVTIENGAAFASGAAATVTAVLTAPDGSVAAARSAPVPPIAANASADVALAAFNVDAPELWALGAPQLYSVQLTVVDAASGAADAVNQPFGFRSISFSVDRGFELNGVPMKMYGGCVHHDNGILGSAAVDAAEWRRVAALKALGYNAIRTSHNPVSEAFLNAADKLGVLIMEEAFDTWTDGKNPDDYHLYFNEWWRADIYAMVRRDRNHPSIIMWSIGNEIGMKDSPEGIALAHNISALVRELDPGSGRAVTSAIAGLSAGDDPYISALDVAGFNYEDHWSVDYWSDHVRMPSRIMLGTESFPSASFQMWDSVLNDTWVLGDFIWSAIDYHGESALGSSGYNTPDLLACGGFTPEPFPWHISGCGDLDIALGRKPQSYYRAVLWNVSMLELLVHPPMAAGASEQIAVWGWEDTRASWTWPGWEGQQLSLRVYTQYPAAMLYLNGERVAGPNTVGKGSQYTFFATIAYQPGSLTAVPCNADGSLIPGAANVTLRTAGPPAAIVLEADFLALPADRRGLAFVRATVVDANGVTVPTASHLPAEYSYNLTAVTISFAAAATPAGAGHLLAVGTGDPIDANVMVGASARSAFRGSVVAVVQPGGPPGTPPAPGVVRLTASADGLPDASIDITVG